MKSVLAFWVRSRTRSSCAARCKAPSRNGIKHSPNSSLRGIPCPLIGVHFRAYRLGPCSEIEIEEALHGTQQRQNLVAPGHQLTRPGGGGTQVLVIASTSTSSRPR